MTISIDPTKITKGPWRGGQQIITATMTSADIADLGKTEDVKFVGLGSKVLNKKGVLVQPKMTDVVKQVTFGGVTPPSTPLRLAFSGGYAATSSGGTVFTYVGPSMIDFTLEEGITIPGAISIVPDSGYLGGSASLELGLSNEDGVWTLRAMSYPYSVSLKAFVCTNSEMLGAYSLAQSQAWGPGGDIPVVQDLGSFVITAR